MGGDQSAPVASTGRAVRYGWAPLVALAGTQFLETGERQSLSQAIDGIQDAFHVSDGTIGWIFTAMTLIGVVGSVPMGILADRSRRTWLLAGAMVLWTLCMGLNGLATSFLFLFLARLGVGAIEANGPAAVSLIADYYPGPVRARMMGLYQAGALVGGLVGLAIGGVAVSVGGWRWAFWMWIPFGIGVALFLFRQPEPLRGHQDIDFEEELAEAVAGTEHADEVVSTTALPPPERVGTLDYQSATAKEVFQELLKIRSMWFGVMSLTISSILLLALQAWGVEFFKRTHDLGAGAAGAYTSLLALGSAAGILLGGFIADRLLRRGMLNARVYVVAFSSIGASAALLPAFLSDNLAVTVPLFLIGGALITMPIAPGEAMVSDVVVADLRGRAATVRSWVRSLAAFSPPLVGILSNRLELSTALALLTPLYAVGGVVMLLAVRTYPSDLSFVVAESRRVHGQR
jgi:MFS family permease